MKIVKNSSENCQYVSREKSMYVAWACFRNAQVLRPSDLQVLLGDELYLSLVVRKPVLGVSDLVPHKPGCTATEDG